MTNVLEKIVADKRLEIEKRKQSLPLEQFVDALTPSTKSMYQALAQENAGFIFECKKASPSKGLIRPEFDLDEILAAYTPHAAAISVLTDEKYFQGKFEYLDYVTARVSQPVLNKDFFVEPYQVYLARHHNADAILLMLSVLRDEEYRALAGIAEQFSLDVLTEVSNQQEAERAVALGAKIIGINNRNLRDLSTDLATTEALAPYIREQAPNALVISESGIYTNADVRRLAPLSDGFLVGSSLMAEQDVSQAVTKLVFGLTKVCGLTQAEDAEAVKNAGASYAGLIFAPKSKRIVSLERAKAITTHVPFHYVGVFVDQNLNDVAEITSELQLAAVQLHGDEDQAYIDQLKAKLPKSTQIWKALGVRDELPTLALKNVDKYLLDCQVGSQSGGTGQRFDWRLLAGLQSKHEVILAGGLAPDNLTDAIAQHMGGLDLNSGAETAPGQKDHDKIAAAFAVLRSY